MSHEPISRRRARPARVGRPAWRWQDGLLVCRKARRLRPADTGRRCASRHGGQSRQVARLELPSRRSHSGGRNTAAGATTAAPGPALRMRLACSG
jgi:hypothetical protein